MPDGTLSVESSTQAPLHEPCTGMAMTSNDPIAIPWRILDAQRVTSDFKGLLQPAVAQICCPDEPPPIHSPLPLAFQNKRDQSQNFKTCDTRCPLPMTRHHSCVTADIKRGDGVCTSIKTSRGGLPDGFSHPTRAFCVCSVTCQPLQRPVSLARRSSLRHLLPDGTYLHNLKLPSDPQTSHCCIPGFVWVRKDLIRYESYRANSRFLTGPTSVLRFLEQTICLPHVVDKVTRGGSSLFLCLEAWTTEATTCRRVAKILTNGITKWILLR